LQYLLRQGIAAEAVVDEAIVNASIHLRTTALQGVPGASPVVRGKIAAGSVAPGAASLASRAEKVAAVAAEHAAAVDRDSRFPAEAIAAARAERLMGVAVSRELGGEGASVGDVVDVCYALGRACAARACQARPSR
jgi:acyl-CoA dehydrogenase